MIVVWLIIILLLIAGLLGIIYPKASWYLSNWWRYQGNASPSEASLLLHRFGGIAYCIVAIILIYIEIH